MQQRGNARKRRKKADPFAGKKIKELYFIKGNKACVLDRNQIINGDFKALDDIL